MLCDLVTNPYQSPSAATNTAPDFERVRSAMLTALAQQLASGDPETQRSALHGLGHLAHVDAPAVIDRFLHSGRWLEPDIVDFALAASTGDIL